MNLRLAHHERDVLETIIRGSPIVSFDVAEQSGYERSSAYRAIQRLQQLGLIEKRSGFIWSTERGKIFLAILMGKESRARSLRASPCISIRIEITVRA